MLPRHEPLFEPINLGKLHLANRTQAALYALREGLAQLDS